LDHHLKEAQVNKKFGTLKTSEAPRLISKRLLASASLIAVAITGAATAQTEIPNGDNQSRSSQTDGETIVVSSGVTSTVAGAPLLIIGNNNVTLNNAGTLVTTGLANTLTLNGNGTIVNNTSTGSIVSESRAIEINGSGASITNEGSILGTLSQRNGTIYANDTANDFTITNSGVIDAGDGQIGAGFSAELSEGGNDFDIVNSGSIVGRGDEAAGLATAGDGIRLERTRVEGALNAPTTGLFTGTITNSGTISSEGANGTVAGFRAVNGVSFQGTLTNEAGGVISGTQNGVYFGNPTPVGGGDHTGGVVNNAGTISSGSRALNIDGIGLEVNNLEGGQILGTGNQRNGTVYADGTADDFSFSNAGLVDAGAGNTGSGFGAEIGGTLDGANTFDLVNSGTIQGRGQASAADNAAGDGIRIGNVGNIGVFDGTITNSGTINSESTQGTTAGIRFVNGIGLQGTLTNEADGVISGAQNGLYFGNPVNGEGADHTGGVVNNAGTISSGSRALNIDGIGLTVNNSGSILGTGDQRNGTVYFDGTANNITLNNLVDGVIDAGAGNNGSGVSIQALAGERTHTILNAGTIQGRGTALASGEVAGLRVFYPPNMMRPIVNLDIDNTGTIASETSAGILLENITFAGDITNSGTISGATAAIDGRTSFGDIVINQNGGSLLGGVLTGNGNDTLNISGGTITGTIDLGAGNNQVNIVSDGEFNVTETINVISNVNVAGTVNFDFDATSQINILSPGFVTGDGSGTINDLTFEAGSEINLAVDDVTSVFTSEPRTLFTTTAGFTDNGVTVTSADSFLVDFTVSLDDQRPQDGLLSVNVVANAVDLGALSDDANISAFGDAFSNVLQNGNGNAAFAANANAINGFTSTGQFEAAAASLLPTLNEGVTRELYETQNQVLSLIEGRFGDEANEGNGIWGQAFGRTADRDSEGGLTFSGYDADSYGFVIGADTNVAENVRAGFAFSYADIDVEETGGALEDTSIDSYSLNAYAAFENENTFVNGALSYVFGNADSSRQAIVDTIASDFDVDQFSAKVTAGYKTKLGDVEVSPFASLQYANISQDDFTEIGGLNLAIDADSVTIFETGVGAKFALPIERAGYKLVPQVSLGWYYDLADEARELSASFAGSNSFRLRGVDPSASSFEVDAALGIYTSGNMSITVGYEGEFRSGFDSHAGVARVRFAF
jgi:uncharacterized protein with beta-barrel porin domain